MNYYLGARSRLRLRGVHPDLVAVVKLAIKLTPIDVTVLEGMRTLKRQQQYFDSGASKTLNSRHLTGHAVDIAPYVNRRISWHWPHYHTLSPAIKRAADLLGVPVEWGGDWTSFVDGPHWQLARSEYGPDDRNATPRVAYQLENQLAVTAKISRALATMRSFT